jgi:hypothetical protein
MTTLFTVAARPMPDSIRTLAAARLWILLEEKRLLLEAIDRASKWIAEDLVRQMDEAEAAARGQVTR